MTVTARNVDGLTRDRLLEFANARDEDREALIELAGKWKHNWIPLDAIAAAIKAKRMKGGGVRRSSADTGAVRAAGKTRFDPKGAAAHSALTSGARGKARPPARAAVTQAKTEARKASQHASDLYDRRIGSRAESAATREHLLEVARAHEAADAAHHRAGSPSEAEWHRGEADRLRRHAQASRPARSRGVPGVDDRPPGTPAEAKRAAALGLPDGSTRHAQIYKEIKVRKLTEGGNVSFLAEHSNGVNTVSARIPQQRGRTDHEHRLAAREALAKGIRRDHPHRRPGAGQSGENYYDTSVAQDLEAARRARVAEMERLHAKPVGENAPSVRGSTQADRDKALRAQREAQTAAAISTLAGRDMADLRRLAESKKVKPKVRAAALAELRRRETPEQTAQRIGMEFVKPTVKGHTVIGEGTVEAPAGTAGARTPDEFVQHASDDQLRAMLADRRYASWRAKVTTELERRGGGAGKAGAAAEPAAPAKKPRKPSALHQEYRTRREEQDRRFEAHTGGGVAAADTHTQEYRDYFGVGDHSTTPQEQRLTFKSFLEERRQGAEYQRRQQQAYDAGAQLGAKHGDHSGDTSSHEAEYQHASTGHDEEMFGQGYSDGVIAGAARAEKRQQDNARKMAELEYGRARDTAHATTAAAETEAGHRAAVHAHVAAGRASLAAGRRQEAQHHIAKAEEHKGHADRLAAERQAETSPTAGETRQVDQAAAASPAAAGIRVEHSGDGTLVHGTTRGDTETTSALKAQGFKWSRNLGAWYLPRTWGESTREIRVRGLQARLGDKITVQRGEAARSGTAAERAQAATDRAKEIADQQRARAERFRAESDAQDAAARRISDHIPFGQPILVGHHSERRHRRDLERIQSNTRKSHESYQAAQDAESRARSAESRASMQTDPRAAARRLDRSEAELRSVERKLNGTGKEIHGENHPATGEYADRLKARQRELRQQIEHDRGIAGDRVGPEARYGKHNITPGDVVKIGGRAHVVYSTGPKNAKLMTEVGPLPYAYSQIQSVGKLDAVSTEALKKLLARHNELGRIGVTHSARRLPPAVIDRIEAILRDRGES